MAGKSGAIKQGRAFVELFTEDSKLVRGLRKAENQVREFGNKVNGSSKAMMGAAAGILAPLALAARSFAQQGSMFKDMSMRTGIAVESLSAFEYVASQTGTTMETLEKGVRLSQKAIGTISGQKSLKELGMDLKKLKKMSPEDQFIAIADYIGRIPNQANRAAAAMKVFGKGGADLLPMMAEGQKGVRALMEEAQSLGLVMSSDDANAADALDDSIARINLQFKRMVAQIGASLAPILQELSQKLSEIIPRVAEWIKTHQGLIVMVAKSAAMLLVFCGAMFAVGRMIMGISALIRIVRVGIPIIASLLSGLRPIMMALMNPWILLPVIVLGAIVALRGGFAEIGRVFGAVTQGMGDALANGNIQLAGKIMWTGLKLLWAEGTQDIRDLWDGLITGMKKGMAMFATLFKNKKIRSEIMAGIDSEGAAKAEARLNKIIALRNELESLTEKAKNDRQAGKDGVKKATGQDGYGGIAASVNNVESVVGSFYSGAVLSLAAGGTSDALAARTAAATERTAAAVEDIADNGSEWGA